jgi:hypothetical protein
MLDISKINEEQKSDLEKGADALLAEIKETDDKLVSEGAQLAGQADMLQAELSACDMPGKMERLAEDSELEVLDIVGDYAKELDEDEQP